VPQQAGESPQRNSVRFMSPVPVGLSMRNHMKLLSSKPVNGERMVWEVTIELE